MATSCTPARVCTRLSLVRAIPACARVAATAPPLRPQRCKRFVSVSFSAHRVCLSPPAAPAPAPSRQAACTGYARRQLQARPLPYQAQVARLRGAVGHPSRGKDACESGVGHQRAPRVTPIPHHLSGVEDCQDHSHLMRVLHRASNINQLSPFRSRSWPPQARRGIISSLASQAHVRQHPAFWFPLDRTAIGHAPTVQMCFIFPIRLGYRLELIKKTLDLLA
jgi:hypothetical protein